MRRLQIPLTLSLALLACACSGDVEGAGPDPAQEAEAFSPVDELGRRAIQLVDSAAEVVVEVTEHKNTETAAVTIKSLGKELREIEAALNEHKLTMETHPTLAKQWEEAKQQLDNAVSSMTATHPSVAKVITGALSGLGVGY